jgi:hypothetical protein
VISKPIRNHRWVLLLATRAHHAAHHLLSRADGVVRHHPMWMVVSAVCTAPAVWNSMNSRQSPEAGKADSMLKVGPP